MRAVVRRCGGKTCPPGTCDHGKKPSHHHPLRRSIAAVESVLASPGAPLDRRTRSAMEARFAHDFSDVRVHTDARAAESARSIDAAAYTYRRDIVFGGGRYRPGTSDGDRLLAHELAHVVQQRAAGPSSHPIEVGDPHDAAEAEAESAASRAVARPASRHAAIRRQSALVPPAPAPPVTPPAPAPPAAATPVQVCARDLQGVLGYIANHAYIEAPPSRYAVIGPLCPAHWYDNPITGTTAQKWDNSPDPCGKTPRCVPCDPAPGVTDVAQCMRDAFNRYNNPSLYKGLGPNSNTFAGTLARTCCAGMVPKPPALGNCPGWSDPPAPARAGAMPCPPGPTC